MERQLFGWKIFPIVKNRQQCNYIFGCNHKQQVDILHQKLYYLLRYLTQRYENYQYHHKRRQLSSNHFQEKAMVMLHLRDCRLPSKSYIPIVFTPCLLLSSHSHHILIQHQGPIPVRRLHHGLCSQRNGSSYLMNCWKYYNEGIHKQRKI